MKQITWSEYLSFVFFLLIAYYILILALYYRKDLQQFFLSKSHRLSPLNKFSFTNQGSPSRYINDSICELLREASFSSYAKEEIVFGLQKLLGSYDYKELALPAYREFINQFIVEECNKECSIHLSEEDLRVLWIR